MKKQPAVVIVGGGPVGLVLALMLARREIASEVLDARALEAAQADRRLLALSRGTLQLLRPLAALPPAVTAPIRRVHVSSAGEFGRVELGNDDGEPEPLGLTIRYGDLLAPLAEACSRSELVTVSRPSRVTAIRQQPARAWCSWMTALRAKRRSSSTPRASGRRRLLRFRRSARFWRT